MLIHNRLWRCKNGDHPGPGPRLAVRARLDTSARFYSEVLGLPEIEKKTARVNVRWFGLGAGCAIHLILGATEVPASRPRSTHFALATSSFDETVRHLADCRVAFQDLSGALGQVCSDLTVSGRCTFRTRMVTGLRSTMLYLSNSILTIAERIKSACSARLYSIDAWCTVAALTFRVTQARQALESFLPG